MKLNVICKKNFTKNSKNPKPNFLASEVFLGFFKTPKNKKPKT